MSLKEIHHLARYTDLSYADFEKEVRRIYDKDNSASGFYCFYGSDGDVDVASRTEKRGDFGDCREGGAYSGTIQREDCAFTATTIFTEEA